MNPCARGIMERFVIARLKEGKRKLRLVEIIRKINKAHPGLSDVTIAHDMLGFARSRLPPMEKGDLLPRLKAWASLYLRRPTW